MAEHDYTALMATKLRAWAERNPMGGRILPDLALSIADALTAQATRIAELEGDVDEMKQALSDCFTLLPPERVNVVMPATFTAVNKHLRLAPYPAAALSESTKGNDDE